MTIGVLLLRRSFIKVLGCLIQAALDRGHRVIILWSPLESKPGETLQEADLAPWPAATAVPYDATRPDRQFIEHGLEAVVSAELFSSVRAAKLEGPYSAARRAGVRFFSVSYIFDTAWTDPAAYGLLDRTCYVSEYHRQLHWRLYAREFAALTAPDELRAKSAVTGSPMLDHLALVDGLSVRRRYAIREDVPVVVLLSLKLALPDPFRRVAWGRGGRLLRTLRALRAGRPGLISAVWGTNEYRDLAYAVRRLCDRHGAILVVKSRRKNDDPAFLRRVADRFVYDEQTYPYTSMELMALASLCIHFESGGVIEAAFAGVPSISVAVPQGHLDGYPGIDEIYGGGSGSLQNYPGVVWRVPYRDATAYLDGVVLPRLRIDPAARAAYVHHFLGFDDTSSSQRVLDVMEH